MSGHMFASRGPIGAGAPWVDAEPTVERIPNQFDNTVGFYATRRAIGPGLIVQKAGSFIPVSRELLEDGIDVGRMIRDEITWSMDRVVRPWAYPDKGVRFSLTLFPRWVERLLAKWEARGTS